MSRGVEGGGAARPTRRTAQVMVGCILWMVASAATAQHEHHQPAPPPASDSGESVSVRVPDVEVVDQDGEAVDFYTDLVENRVVAINFIFTTCTTICPPMGATFSRLQDLLAESGESDVRLISVSVDPVTDTPERLKAWGDRFGAGDHWTLVTGAKPEVDRLLKSLEVFTPDFSDHSPTVLVGNDAAGRWKRAYGLAPPAKLAELLAEVESSPDGGAQ